MKKELKEYIPRMIVKETEKAYLVEVMVNNRRDGIRCNYKWVGKSVCKPSEMGDGYETLPEEIKKQLSKYVDVPIWVIGDAEW